MVKEQSTLGFLILTGIAVLLGVILVGILAGQTTTNTQLSRATESSNLSASCYVLSTNVVSEAGFINATTYTLTKGSQADFKLVSISMINTTSGLTILAGNYSVSALGVVSNASVTNWNAVTMNYTYTYNGGQVNASSSNCDLTVGTTLTRNQVLDCPLTSFVLTNNTGTVLTKDTDYSFTGSTGLLEMLNTTTTNSTKMGALVYYSYDYCGSNYVSGWGKTMLNMIPGFFALAVLLGVAFVIFYVLRKEGVDIDFN